MEVSVREAVDAGNLMRTIPPSDGRPWVNQYLGNGRFGGCFAEHGLQHAEAGGISKTLLHHADHFTTGPHGFDFWLAVAKLVWETVPSIDHGQQTFEPFQGALTTTLKLADGGHCTLRMAFDPAMRDLAGLVIDYQGQPPPIVLMPVTQATGQYDLSISGDCQVHHSGQRVWDAVVSVGTAQTALSLRLIREQGEGHLETIQTEAGQPAARIVVSGNRGRCLLLLGVAAHRRASELYRQLATAAPTVDHWIRHCDAAWAKRWGGQALAAPTAFAQTLWARSMFYLLASYAPDVRAPAAPMGWSGNGWAFHFPQDIGFVHPALLSMGHVDIAQSIVEFYHSRLADVKAFTRRLWQLDGTMWPWEHPARTGFGDQLLRDGVPNVYQYEIHNAAYPAQMASQTALVKRDRTWASEIAWPVVCESTRFLASAATRGSDGRWGLHVRPSMGQDEFGGTDAPDYLCAIFSLRYLLSAADQMARRWGLDDPDLLRWQQMRAEGTAENRLIDPRYGIRAAAGNLLGTEWMGKQKHPVQLNEVTFLVHQPPDAATMAAWRARQTLVTGVADSFGHGWTLPAFWLAAARLGDWQTLEQLLSLSTWRQFQCGDDDAIQLYESSGLSNKPFYTTSHGLAAQAIIHWASRTTDKTGNPDARSLVDGL